MSIYLKKYQDKSKDTVRSGKWYARPSYHGTVDERGLAREIEKQSTVAEADVLAVLSALVGVMTSALKDTKRVRLTGLGTFKMGVSTAPAESREKLTVRNIKGAHILFTPDGDKDGSTGTVTRAMTAGIDYEWEGDDTDEGKEDSTSDGSQGGGSASDGSQGGSQSSGSEEEGGEHS